MQNPQSSLSASDLVREPKAAATSTVLPNRGGLQTPIALRRTIIYDTIGFNILSHRRRGGFFAFFCYCTLAGLSRTIHLRMINLHGQMDRQT